MNAPALNFGTLCIRLHGGRVAIVEGPEQQAARALARACGLPVEEVNAGEGRTQPTVPGWAWVVVRVFTRSARYENGGAGEVPTIEACQATTFRRLIAAVRDNPEHQGAILATDALAPVEVDDWHAAIVPLLRAIPKAPEPAEG